MTFKGFPGGGASLPLLPHATVETVPGCLACALLWLAKEEGRQLWSRGDVKCADVS